VNVAAQLLSSLGGTDTSEPLAAVWGAVTSGEPADASIEADIVGSTWRLNGEVGTVLWPDNASGLLVVVRSKPIAGRDRGMRVYRVPIDVAGCTVSPRQLLDGEARRVELDGVEVRDTDSVGPARDASASLAMAFDRLCIDAVGEMLAAAQAAVVHALQWVAQREQFGAPLATRQVVQHRAADMDIAIRAVSALHDDAVLASEPGPCAIEAAVAKLVASERLPDVTASAHQLHGGEGYYADRPLAGLHKRVCTLAALFGNGSHQRARLAHLLAE
jgi:alkylation response protein AidB-like acyl-CoA dehydrogenase